MKRGAFTCFFVILSVLTSLAVAPTVEAEEGLGLSHQDMMDNNKVLIHLKYNPDKIVYLAEDFIVALIDWIDLQQQIALGADYALLQSVKFKLNLRLLDLRLEKMLNTKTLTPKGYQHPLVDKSVSDLESDAFVNKAKVTGYGPIDTVVYDMDKAVVKLMQPRIQIEKSPSQQQVVSGQKVGFSITVTNAGDVPLYKVYVEDLQVPDCARELGRLAVGESRTYRCHTIAEGDFNNIATANSYDPNGGAVVASAEASVDTINPSIKIEKTPDHKLVVVGKPINFTVTVTNTGDVPLHKVKVSDPQVPDCERIIDYLDVLDTVSYGCTAGEGQYEGVEYIRGQVGKHNPEAVVEKEVARTETFVSWLGCQLNQTQAGFETRGTDMFVGPCQADGEGGWYFNVLKMP